MYRPLALIVQSLALFTAPAPSATRAVPVQGTMFSRLVERLSEPGGYFDSDNLVSNETSYLHVLPALGALGVRGGAYIGVGPEQSFSYIAEIKPELAVLVDIRRDNLLLHLLFKAMFEVSRNRMEFLCLLYGRPVPDILTKWNDATLEDILTYLDITPKDTAGYPRSHAAMMDRVSRLGVAIADSEKITIKRFHDEFYDRGLDITFTSRGRPSRPGYPTERELYLATDLDGNKGSYLATEERFRFVRDLERRDRVIPAVGDLSGPTAMKAIAAYLREINLPVSAFYVSNVEMYLFRGGTFPQFAENVKALPAGASSVLIRSYFGRGMWAPRNDPGGTLPQVVPGQLSAQQLQTIASFVQLTAKPDVTYWDVLTVGAIDLQKRAPRNKRLGVKTSRRLGIRPPRRPAAEPPSRPA